MYIKIINQKLLKQFFLLEKCTMFLDEVISQTKLKAKVIKIFYQLSLIKKKIKYEIALGEVKASKNVVKSV
jgi:hypothetical protein